MAVFSAPLLASRGAYNTYPVFANEIAPGPGPETPMVCAAGIFFCRHPGNLPGEHTSDWFSIR